MNKIIIATATVFSILIVTISSLAIAKTIKNDKEIVPASKNFQKSEVIDTNLDHNVIGSTENSVITVTYDDSIQLEETSKELTKEQQDIINAQKLAEKKEQAKVENSNISYQTTDDNSIGANSGSNNTKTFNNNLSSNTGMPYIPSVNDNAVVNSLKLYPKPAEVKRSAVALTDAEFRLMVCTVYTEAGDQSFEGQLAVVNVILNRMESSKFPNTLKGVIYAKGQFEVTEILSGSISPLDKYLKVYDTNPNYKHFATTKKAISAALVGRNNMNGYHFFTSAPKPTLVSTGYYKEAVKIGCHYFYKLY